MKLKNVVQFRAGGTPDTGNESFWADDDTGTPWVAIGDMSGGPNVSSTSKSLTPEGITARRLTTGRPGTVLFAMYASVGAVATLGIDAVWNQAILGMTPNDDSDGRFVAYWLRHYGPMAVAEARSATQANLNAAQVANFPFPDRTIEEQRRIADFLDDRVARIDRTIAARREQLERLDSLFVSQVTETIDAAEGERCPLWMMTSRITDGAHVSPETEHGAFDFVSTRDISATGSIDFEGSLKTSPRSYQELVRYGCRPRYGDVLFSKDGTVGRTARVVEDREFVVASSLIIIRPDPARLDFNFLHFLCKHAEFAHQVDGHVKGAGLARISIANLRRVSGIFPPLETQRHLARVLDKQHGSMVRQVQQLTASIDLLTEYKQSLITAAVTGELDVTAAGSGIPL